MVGKVTRWQARYVDNAGEEYTRRFDRKIDAQNWIKSVTASIVRGDRVAPSTAWMLVAHWCDRTEPGQQKGAARETDDAHLDDPASQLLNTQVLRRPLELKYPGPPGST
jgi:hypothetical protein